MRRSWSPGAALRTVLGCRGSAVQSSSAASLGVVDRRNDQVLHISCSSSRLQLTARVVPRSGEMVSTLRCPPQSVMPGKGAFGTSCSSWSADRSSHRFGGDHALHRPSPMPPEFPTERGVGAVLAVANHVAVLSLGRLGFASRRRARIRQCGPQ